jgi:hypothetical protein
MGQSDRPPTLRHVPWLLARFAPHYVRHLLLRPFRGRPPLASLRGFVAAPARCHHIAMYDAVLELMLRGYADLAEHPLRPDTGRIAVAFTRIGFAFDDEYERREAAAESLAFDDVFASPAVLRPLQEWRELMRDVEAYPRIRDTLGAFVRRLYADYRDAHEEPAADRGFDVLVRRAAMDSGGLLVALAHVVGLLHGAPPTPAVVEEFTALGLTAKLADDIVDFAGDRRGGRPNLLDTDASAEAEARIVAALATGTRMSARWWRRNCPPEYLRIVAVYTARQAAMTSPWLAYTARLMWIPALLGHVRAVETRGRI